MTTYEIDVITTGSGSTPAEKQNLINAAEDQIDQKIKQYSTYLAQSGRDVPSKIYATAIVLGEGIVSPLVALHITDKKLDISLMDDEEFISLYETAKAAEETYNGFDASETVTKVLSTNIIK